MMMRDRSIDAISFPYGVPGDRSSHLVMRCVNDE